MIKRTIGKEQSKLIDSGFLDTLGQDKDGVKLNSLGKMLLELAGGVMTDAADNLNKKNAVSSGKLASDMGQEITADGKFLETVVKILDYGKYLDEGVNGTKHNRGSRFSFKNQFVSKAFIESIRKWVIRENLSARTIKRKIGKETKSGMASNQAAAYDIAQAIKRNGIEPRKFMTDAITKLQTKLTDDNVLAAFKIDVIAALPDGSEFR